MKAGRAAPVPSYRVAAFLGNKRLSIFTPLSWICGPPESSQGRDASQSLSGTKAPGIQASTGLWRGEPTLPMSPLLCILGEEKWGGQGLSPTQAALGLFQLSDEAISPMKSDTFCI